jgi:hypothetical protein
MEKCGEGIEAFFPNGSIEVEAALEALLARNRKVPVSFRLRCFGPVGTKDWRSGDAGPVYEDHGDTCGLRKQQCSLEDVYYRWTPYTTILGCAGQA